jgi:hypothetical protein
MKPTTLLITSLEFVDKHKNQPTGTKQRLQPIISPSELETISRQRHHGRRSHVWRFGTQSCSNSLQEFSNTIERGWLNCPKAGAASLALRLSLQAHGTSATGIEDRTLCARE